jgi:hypothetical protein
MKNPATSSNWYVFLSMLFKIINLILELFFYFPAVSETLARRETAAGQQLRMRIVESSARSLLSVSSQSRHKGPRRQLQD